MRMGSRGRGGNLSCERVVVAQVGDGEVVMQTSKYSVTGHPCRIGRQVLRGGGILLYRPSAVHPLFDDRHLVGPSPGPRQSVHPILLLQSWRGSVLFKLIIR
jgi:hypothetical protein